MLKPLRVLGIETSGLSGSVALAEGGKIIAHRAHSGENQHAEKIFGLIEEALEEAGWDRASLGRVAVSRGPGAFTALRIGMAVADGLSLGFGIEAVTVSSLEALAFSPFAVLGEGAPERQERELLVALRDARRSELFVGMFGRDGRPLAPPEAIAVDTAREELLRRLDGRRAYVVGQPGLELGFSSDLPSAFHAVDPDARAVALLGAERKSEGPIRPEYVRGPNVVKPNLPPSPLAEIEQDEVRAAEN